MELNKRAMKQTQQRNWSKCFPGRANCIKRTICSIALRDRKHNATAAGRTQGHKRIARLQAPLRDKDKETYIHHIIETAAIFSCSSRTILRLMFTSNRWVGVFSWIHCAFQMYFCAQRGSCRLCVSRQLPTSRGPWVTSMAIKRLMLFVVQRKLVCKLLLSLSLSKETSWTCKRQWWRSIHAMLWQGYALCEVTDRSVWSQQERLSYFTDHKAHVRLFNASCCFFIHKAQNGGFRTMEFNLSHMPNPPDTNRICQGWAIRPAETRKIFKSKISSNYRSTANVTAEVDLNRYLLH